MSEGRPRQVPPSITETAFSCPHCGALTTQTWFKLYAETLKAGQTPFRVSDTEPDAESLSAAETDESRQEIREWFQRMSAGTPFLDRKTRPVYPDHYLSNANVARCFNCSRLTVWIGNDLAWPVLGEAPAANPDLSEDVRLDYDEAGRIVGLSPRGAAALLRLAIQKLCKELKCKGRTIDENIAELVAGGLDVRIQRALDIVRVIGNEAVHPGQVDLRDDRAIAVKLFELVNIIADKMISQPKAIDAMYEDLPPSKREAIERRDGQTSK